MFNVYMIINRNTREVLTGPVAPMHDKSGMAPLAWASEKAAEAFLDTLTHGIARQLKVVQVRPWSDNDTRAEA